jgi:CRP-like cAMP-binding protein
MDQEVFQTKSELLRRMSAVDFARLKPHLRSVFLDLRAPLEEAGQKIKFVYFLESGLASVVAKRSAAAEAEVGIIGFEGMTASALIMGDDQAPHDCYIQSTCEALQIDARHFVDVLETSPTLRRFLLRYVQSFHVQASYTAWVNARSTLEPRLARWLLMCSDRTVGDRLMVTHEFLSIMLGVRRPGVTVGLQQIEGRGFIRARRGEITIRDREGLLQPASGMGHPRRNIAGLWVNWDLPHPPGKNVQVPSSQTRQRRIIGQRPG